MPKLQSMGYIEGWGYCEQIWLLSGGISGSESNTHVDIFANAEYVYWWLFHILHWVHV